MKTPSIRTEDIEHQWYVVDANQKTLGRLAAKIAHRLKGKHKPEYSPHVDAGDYIVVINAEKIHTTGNKVKDKIYHRHSGYPGGIKATSLGDMLERHPTRALSQAIKGMLPRNPLGRSMYRKLKVYQGGEHPHQAQNPASLAL